MASTLIEIKAWCIGNSQYNDLRSVVWILVSGAYLLRMLSAGLDNSFSPGLIRWRLQEWV